MKRKVVVCDSNLSVLNALCVLLEDLETVVVPVLNLADLVGVLENADSDILFIDIQMPQQNCSRILRSIKESAKLQKLPIIVLCRDVLDRAFIHEAGADGCLVKPFGMVEVESYLRRFVYER
ncbi:response regulator [Sphingobacterium sp. InxBP1]|uniref:response regulator n=1 Tax=Sphingobacterium TaxID=28453 RepID=UPI003A102D96|nr:response regulator [Sphingobacterium sp. InxBP1]